MNSKDILSKAQKVHEDEYEIKIEADSRRFTLEFLGVLSSLVFFYFVFFEPKSYAIIAGNKVPMDLICYLPWLIGEATYHYYRFIKLRIKKNLVWAILASLVITLLLVTMILGSPLL